jgi:hypothetical protein
VTDHGLLSRPGPLRWWMLLVVVIAMAALFMVGRHAPISALDPTPVNLEPAPPAALTHLLAV